MSKCHIVGNHMSCLIYFHIIYISILLFLQDLNTNVFNDMVIEVMRWLKKATTDNHEDLQKLTFRILRGISQFYLTSLKDVLQDIVDVMIKLEIYDELSGRYNTD